VVTIESLYPLPYLDGAGSWCSIIANIAALKKKTHTQVPLPDVMSNESISVNECSDVIFISWQGTCITTACPYPLSLYYRFNLVIF